MGWEEPVVVFSRHVYGRRVNQKLNDDKVVEEAIVDTAVALRTTFGRDLNWGRTKQKCTTKYYVIGSGLKKAI